MRIHTNLTRQNIRDALVTSGAPIHFEKLEEHGSRSRERAFDVRLGGTGGRNNTGLYGAGDYDGATWDQWGAFLGAVFTLDPNAYMPTAYRTADHFYAVTGDRFKARTVDGRTTHYPADTHKRHSWKPIDGNWRNGMACAFKGGCTATNSARVA